MTRRKPHVPLAATGSMRFMPRRTQGTEKASPHGFTLNNVGYKLPRGGYTGASGRVRFTPAHTITVKPAMAAE